MLVLSGSLTELETIWGFILTYLAEKFINYVSDLCKTSHGIVKDKDKNDRMVVHKFCQRNPFKKILNMH